MPPEAVAEGGDYQVRLHQCPFREVAERHQDVVCALHLGVMQGMLAQLRTLVTADHLRPLAEPSVCIADLAGHAPEASARKGEPARPRRGAREEGSGIAADACVSGVYDDPAPRDWARVLVDRVWPRGLRKEAARLDDWARDAAPSTHLRTWYRHDLASSASSAASARRVRRTRIRPCPAARAARLSRMGAGPGSWWDQLHVCIGPRSCEPGKGRAEQGRGGGVWPMTR